MATILAPDSRAPLGAVQAASARRPALLPVDSRTVLASSGFVMLGFVVLLASGGAIFLFVALHLAQLTFGATLSAFDRADPYRNLIAALRSWPVALAYVAAAAAVGVHLLTGTWTGMRSLRLIRPRTERLARVLAPAIALVVALGIAAVPAAVLVGVLN